MIKAILSFINPSVLVCIGVVVFAGYSSYQLGELKEEIALRDRNISQGEVILIKKNYELKEALLHLDIQGRSIEQLKLDKQKIEEQRIKTKRALDKKYANMVIPNIDSSCSEKLQHYERLFERLGR